MEIMNSDFIDWNGCILKARALDAPLPEYLLSRSKAGCTGEELIESMAILCARNPSLLTVGNRPRVSGNFVPFSELLSRGKSLINFCGEELRRGHCLVVTLNLQLVGNDAWHHQVVYGIDTDTEVLYCLNPHCQYSQQLATSFLSTDSTLLVRREDVIERFARPGGDESIYSLSRWKEYKVQEQIEDMMNALARSNPAEFGSNTDSNDYAKTIYSRSGFVAQSARSVATNEVRAVADYIRIPAEYVGGISIFSARSHN